MPLPASAAAGKNSLPVNNKKRPRSRPFLTCAVRLAR